MLTLFSWRLVHLYWNRPRFPHSTNNCGLQLTYMWNIKDVSMEHEHNRNLSETNHSNLCLVFSYRVSIDPLGTICFSGRIPRPSLIQHSLYVGVVEKPPPPPLTGEQYGKVEPKYPESCHCHSVYIIRGFLTSIFIFSNSVEMTLPFNVVSHPRCCELRN